MTPYEAIALAYFSVFAVAAWGARVASRRRRAVLSIAVGMAALAVLAGTILTQSIRPWAAHLYLLAGYWLPSLLVSDMHSRRFEEWLRRSDAAIRGRLPAVPATLTSITELAYLLCYPLVPFAFLVVWVEGTDANVQHFWSSVLLAGYACYATLPWLVSRPPRLRHAHAAAGSRLGALNVLVLDRLSHRFTTFPSGHVAVAAAAAAMVTPVSPAAAVGFGFVVILIGIGAAAGGYHYVVDVVTGLAVAGVAVAIVGIW